MDDRFRDLKAATRAAALDGPAHTPAELRRAVARGEPPAELAPLVARIRGEPWAVTDEDWAALRAAHDEDAQFELVVAAVLGAAEERFVAAVRAVEEA